MTPQDVAERCRAAVADLASLRDTDYRAFALILHAVYRQLALFGLGLGPDQIRDAIAGVEYPFVAQEAVP